MGPALLRELHVKYTGAPSLRPPQHPGIAAHTPGLWPKMIRIRENYRLFSPKY